MAKVLIVDDAAFMRMMLKDILTKNGFEVAGEAQNGLLALEFYKNEKPDLVTMDITMPEMDGIQALKQIKGIDPTAKVIMCSAMGQQSMVMEAIKSGARDFIVKPFQPDRVLEAIKKVLEQE
jgi:two-component system chemotaxis response regulator CheY